MLNKLPPQALDMEKAVLGALMLESNTIHTVAPHLTPEMFYTDQHCHIYRSILTLYQNSSPIDQLTVTEQLRKEKRLEEVGGAYYITELTDSVNSSAHIFSHCKIIQEKWIKREAISISFNTTQESYKDITDPFSLLDAAIGKYMGVLEQITKGKEKSYAEMLDDSVSKTLDRMTLDSHVIGIPTNFKDLDTITGGLCAPDLIILAARPGMGKTAFAVQLALSAAKNNYPVGIFSLEMSGEQLTQRTQSSESGINLRNIITGNVDEHQMSQVINASEELKKHPVFIDDTAGLNLVELKSKCYMMKNKHDIKLVVLDYIQLMDYGYGNREEGIGRISKGLKSIAKELDIPVIALSQLSRDVEKRGGDKRPHLSDLRESGSIEQDADTVWFLYRPEYYGITFDDDGNNLKGMAELIIAKNRSGALDTINLKFIGRNVRFDDFIPQTNQQVIDYTSNKIFKDQEINFNQSGDDTPF